MSTTGNSERRVVVTGIGVVSPIGIGVDHFWNSLAAGRSGVARSEFLPFSAAPDNVLAEVRDFTESSARKQYLAQKEQRKSIKVMCREIQMGVASASLAMEDSGLNLEQIDHERFGVDFGANLMFSPPDVLKDACWACVETEGGQPQFHYEKWGHEGLATMEPLWLLKYLPNMPACHIGIFADARGPNNSLTLDEASGNLAVGEAFRIITRGHADVMIAGTTGTRVHPVKAMHAALWDTLASEPPEAERRSRPFDRDRSGQVIGEAACSLILEEESHARQRGARIYATILGSGAAFACRPDETGDIRHALAAAMRAALNSSGIPANEIGHLNAHGLGTRSDDVEEAAAIHDVFGAAAEKVPVTALKSYFGNAGSGCGVLELAGSLLGLWHGVVPQTLNYDTPDPDCRLNVVHGEPLPIENRSVLNVNVTRLGKASAVVASRG